MGLVNNASRLYFDGCVEGSAHALLPGCWDSYRQFQKFIMPDGASAVLQTVANPPGFYLPCVYHPPIKVGEMSWRPEGEGVLTAYLYPAMQMQLALTGVGTLTLDISGRKPMELSVTGSGTLAADIEAYGNLVAALVGTGDLDAAIAGGVAMVAALSGSGNLTAAASLVTAMALALSGSGTLAAGISGRLAMAADIFGSGDLDASAQGRWNMALAATGSGDLDASMVALGNMIVELTGEGDLDAAIGAIGNMSIDLVVTGTGLTSSNVGAAVWAALASANNVAGTMGNKLNSAASAGDPWGTDLPGSYAPGTAGYALGQTLAGDLPPQLAIVRAILQNKTVTDPTTGVMTVYADDGVTPLFVANVFENVSGTQPYRGQGADRRDALT